MPKQTITLRGTVIEVDTTPQHAALIQQAAEAEYDICMDDSDE